MENVTDDAKKKETENERQFNAPPTPSSPLTADGKVILARARGEVKGRFAVDSVGESL